MSDSHHDPGAAYSEVFEEGNDTAGKAQNIHRIRANSSIMKLKKILGESLLVRPTEGSIPSFTTAAIRGN